MDTLEERIKQDYRQNLDPKEFQEFKLQGLKDDKEENNYDFWFSCLCEFFSSENISADRLLDLGSGPTVHNVATASAYVPNIVLSEFVESNCEHLRNWLRQDPDCLDWSPFLRRVAKAEGRKDLDVASKEIEARIRAAVKAVIHCDVLKDEVIAEEFKKVPYDIILTALTLETAAVSWESFSAILGRVNRLLRRGGKLIMLGPTLCNYWKVGNNQFHCLSLEEADIQRALQINGFGDIRWRLREEPDGALPFNCKKLYFLSCNKL